MVNGGNGDDTINASSLAADVIGLAIDGGGGNDTIIGSQGADRLLGGDGSDTVVGGRGNDTALLGNGNDKFIWNPGDGSDVVEGEAGTDTLVFNGANISETMDISANGSRARLFRDIGNITMDLTRPEGDRILNLSYKNKPLAMDQRLKVELNSYRANGGGGFEMLRRAPHLTRAGGDVREAIAAAIRHRATLDGSFERNWRLLPDYVEISVYRALVESTAGFFGAQMTAMRSASDNAGEIITELTLQMNRARQAEITQEIMEVVAGAEGLR